ncbi:K+/H+ antiporter subunit F [Lutibaculum baratangense]|uniref:Na(+) H(+) antiporter subunit F n=1 Tax=Lutibaculum baratangense AMV1 TaxID=631454 RepID=V4R4N2_9HYPH|nr:K+/H+ antiporter subunit F [Lutibaculum baratangense]ESR26882.1 Na(+) H(+) antiporter subunit F [Lutibaculum baratangense AMV1]
MIFYASVFAAVAVSIASLLTLYRLLIGPHVTDRILALDTLTINAIALIMLAGIFWETTTFFEAAMLFAMVGFVATVAFCKYIVRGNVME